MVLGTRLLVDYQVPGDYIFEKMELLHSQPIVSSQSTKTRIALTNSLLTMKDTLLNPYSEVSDEV